MAKKLIQYMNNSLGFCVTKKNGVFKMLKKVSLLLFFIFVSSAAAEDITIHSKNSDTAAGYVKILIKRLNDQQMQNLLSLENVKALSEVLNTYTDVDYGPQGDLTAKIQTINDREMASF